MPEIMNPQRSDDLGTDPVTARVRETRAGLAALLDEAATARRLRHEAAGGKDAGGSEARARDGAPGDEVGGGKDAPGKGASGNGVRGIGADGEDADSAGARENGSAVCAWNHFENIPTFYNWNNRPR